MAQSSLPTPSLSEPLLAARQEGLSVVLQHGIHNLCIFGSLARGLDRPDNVLDLLGDFVEGQSLLETITLRL